MNDNESDVEGLCRSLRQEAYIAMMLHDQLVDLLLTSMRLGVPTLPTTALERLVMDPEKFDPLAVVLAERRRLGLLPGQPADA